MPWHVIFRVDAHATLRGTNIVDENDWVADWVCCELAFAGRLSGEAGHKGSSGATSLLEDIGTALLLPYVPTRSGQHPLLR